MTKTNTLKLHTEPNSSGLNSRRNFHICILERKFIYAKPRMHDS